MMKTKILTLGLICLCLLSCKEIKSPHSSPLINPLLPIISFMAEPNQILGGEFTLLSWSVVNGISATLNDGENTVPINLEDTRKMWPRESTTYVLAASNRHGSINAIAKVEVLVAANVSFDGYVALYRSVPPRIGVVGILRNLGNVTAINIVVHVELFDPLGNELTHLTRLFINVGENSSRLETGDGHSIEYYWTISESICSQIDEYNHSWNSVYATWDDE